MRTYQQLLAAGSISVAVWFFSGCGSQDEVARSGTADSITIHEFANGSKDQVGSDLQDLCSTEAFPGTEPPRERKDLWNLPRSEDTAAASVNTNHDSAPDDQSRPLLPPAPDGYGSRPLTQDGRSEEWVTPKLPTANISEPKSEWPVPAATSRSESDFAGTTNDISKVDTDPEAAAETAVTAESRSPRPKNRPETAIMIAPTRKSAMPAQDRSEAGRVRTMTGKQQPSSATIRRPGAAVVRQGFSNEVVFFATNRAPDESPRATTDPDLYFGAKRGALQYGKCEVSIPYQRSPGSLPSPSILKLEFTQDPARHVVLMQIQLQGDDLFWESLRNDIESREHKNLMLFVHGYSASFRDAARRTAQIAYDMNYTGPAMFFSWPAGSETEGFNRWNYTNDLRRADESCEDFITVVEAVAARSGATSVHLVVHSMGNHLVTESLKTMADRRRSAASAAVLFDAVAMAAPDIDAQEFVDRTADRIRPFSRRFAVYASKHDKALSFSAQLNGWRPLGLLSESSLQLAAKEQFDLIDVSDISGGWFASGHVYYGDMPEVIRDLHGVFMGRSVQSRGLLANSPVLRLVRQASR